MTSRTFPSAFEGKSATHLLALACVALTFAASGIVFSEPAPVDALMMGLAVLLPVVGLTAITPLLLVYLALWLVAAASAFLAATMSLDLARSATHSGVSLFLYVGSFVTAAFIARRPKEHTELILVASLVAALIAAAAGIAGYMNAAPGAYDLFTKFGRATGTFKDPNVFGPFLVAPFLFALHLALQRPLREAHWPLALAGFLALGVLLSFSRGAWMNLAVALAIYGYFSFVTADSEAMRQRILTLVAIGAALVAIVVAGALQNEQVASLLSERASMTQSYDVGPEGRFGGQQKALDLILENPLGIGAQQFAPVFHHEEPHNVYLSIVLNAGWLGGGIYWLMVALTLGLGLRHALRVTATRPLFLIAYATFAANAFEGVIIDSDHWRHFYLLMAIVWGLMANPGGSPHAQPGEHRTRR